MSKGIKTILFIVWLILLIFGTYAVFQRLTLGHKLAAYGSYIPWGLWVAAKVYFVGLGVGASLIAWIGLAFNFTQFKALTKLSLILSLACLIAGLVVITFDLGHMFRTVEVFYRPNFKSMLAIATWLTVIYLLYVFFAYYKTGIKKQELSKSWGWIGIVLATIFSMLINGSEFATLVSSPYWHSSLAPLMSISGDLLTGISLILFLIVFLDYKLVEKDKVIQVLSNIVLGLLCFVFLLEISDLIVTSWYKVGETYPIIKKIVFGPSWEIFWIYHLLLGVFIPLALLVFARGEKAKALSGFLISAFYFAVRYNHVLPGQTQEMLKGIAKAYVDKRLHFSYSPTFFEWEIFGFSVAILISVFYLGQKLSQSRN